MCSHDYGADASFCIFFAPVTNCIFTVWVPPCEENCKCPDPNAVVVDKNIAENDRFDLFSR